MFTVKFMLYVNCVNCKCVNCTRDDFTIRLVTNKSTRGVLKDYTILRNKTMTSNIKDKKILSKQVTRPVYVTLVINLVLDFTVHLKTTGRRHNRKRSIKTLISN